MLRKALAVAAGVVAVGLGVAGATLYVLHRVSDGPLGPLSGGPLRSGPLAAARDVDWSSVVLEQDQLIELELVATGESRLTGGFVHDGRLYVPCDLGFIWRRAPTALFRTLGLLLFEAKHWNRDAERDGRAVLRVGGTRYERQLVRMTDPELLAVFRARMETAARRYLGSLLDAPGDPDAIWFFRADPR